MGNKHEKSTFEEENFSIVGKEGNKTILYNPNLNKSIEKHESMVVGGIDEVKRACEWRAMLSPNSPIVQVYEYGIKEGGICNGRSQLYVITERVHLFRDIRGITQVESFLLLKKLLKGLAILFQHFGHFTPLPSTFGLNNEGKTKVWLNENFALHRPAETSERKKESEMVVVNNLIRMVEEKVEQYTNNQVLYPINLNIRSAISYIERVMELKGFKIDRVYFHREEYEKGLSAIREREEREVKTKITMIQCEKKSLEIEKLKQILKQQQVQLGKKDARHVVSHPNISNVEPVDSKSQKKVLGWTASTNRSGELQHLPQITSPRAVGRSNLPFPPLPLRRPPINKPFLVPNHRERARETSIGSHQSLRKQIELVDSMLVVEEDITAEQNKRYIESRVVGRPGSQGYNNF